MKQTADNNHENKTYHLLADGWDMRPANMARDKWQLHADLNHTLESLTHSIRLEINGSSTQT